MKTLAKVGLAPMEGVTELAIRLWMAQASSPDFCWTPFLRITETFPGKTLPEAYAPELRFPHAVTYELIPQIMASDSGYACRAGEQLLEENIPFVDLNCGCPAPRVVGNGAGSSILERPENFRQFIKHLCDNLGAGKLSVKMRTGFATAEEFPRLIEAVADLPLARLTIHGRTRSDRYGGEARWDLIQYAAANLPYPVVGSGDILSPLTLAGKKSLAPTVGDVIIGRGALRHPWVFKELRDGRTPYLTVRALKFSLGSLALFLALERDHEAKLLEMLKDGAFANDCGTDEEKWEKLYLSLATAANAPRDPALLEVHRMVLGRVKMIWNYFRSSLPQVFFEPTVLRSASFSALWTRIEELAAGQDAFLPLTHKSHLDWVYSSDKKADPQSEMAATPVS